MELKGNYPAQTRPSDSPYIQWMWWGVSLSNGTHTAAADGNLDLVLMKRAGRVRMLLSGPSTKARTTEYRVGDENIGVRLRRGVHIPAIASTKLLDIDSFLPNAGQHSFWFEGSAIPFPTYNTIEAFIERLVRLGMLRRDVVVEDVLAGRIRSTTSMRTVQRHFLGATGVTPSYMSQIQRAERALDLLQQGEPILYVAQEAGFSDQSHLTNSLKRLLGHTPATLQRLALPLSLKQL